jgi:hypothetical protein
VHTLSMSRNFVVFSLCALPSLAWVAGCARDDPQGPQIAAGPTFHKDVEPLLQKSCMGCHSPGNIAPFSLLTYEDAKSAAALIAKTTRARTMPPWGARNTDECTTNLRWKGDISLSDEEIDTLDAWSKAGAPEGDPSDAPPAFVPKSHDLPNMTHEIHPNEPYVTSGDKDEFKCFVIDPGFTEDQYMNGLQVVPGNPKVVHHVVMLVDPNRVTEQVAGPDGSFPCGPGDDDDMLDMGGMPDMPGDMMGMPGEVINAWAPGSGAFELPEGVGYRIPKGSLMVLQIHYHPAGTTADPDMTRIQLRLSKEKPKYGFMYQLLSSEDQPIDDSGTGLLPGPDDTNGVEFLIPANSKHHVETQQFTIPAAGSPGSANFPVFPGMRIYGEWLHMHYLGFDQKVTIIRPNAPSDQPQEECLVHAPEWDFSWQRSYAYDSPIESLPTIEPGDILKIRCTYDNSTDNPYVVRALQEAHLSSPIDVSYGEGATFDEMCSTGVSIIYPMP